MRTKEWISYSRYSNRLNHYEERLRKTIERSLRKRHAIRNDGIRRYYKKYKVSDDDVDNEVQKVKNQFGDQFKGFLENNRLKDEADFKNQMKFKLALHEAVKKSVTEKDVKDHYKPEIKASHILVSDENADERNKEKTRRWCFI